MLLAQSRTTCGCRNDQGRPKDSSPLVSHTQKSRGGLRRASTCRSLYYERCDRFGKVRTLLFFFMMPNYSAHKREEKLFFLYCGFRPKKGEEWLGFSLVSHTKAAGFCSQVVPNFSCTSNPILVTLNHNQIRVKSPIWPATLSPQNRRIISCFVGR